MVQVQKEIILSPDYRTNNQSAVTSLSQALPLTGLDPDNVLFDMHKTANSPLYQEVVKTTQEELNTAYPPQGHLES